MALEVVIKLVVNSDWFKSDESGISYLKGMIKVSKIPCDEAVESFEVVSVQAVKGEDDGS